MVNPNEIPELFGSLVFNDRVMRAKLPKDVYKTLKKTIDEDAPLEIDVANVVANAMKEWALEHGATHFTHWFQPMTGITAEKHDSFIEPAGDGVVMELSGKSLIKGEPDASSFPSGGLRATFEARGYTAWDPTSYAFIKEKTLCIPTAFCAYGGQALDKKAPLLRSMEALNTQAMRVLHLFGNETRGVRTTVGAEQEYFLVDRAMYERREDLRLCGRTLFGAPAPRGQELDDHYFGALKPRVKAFMEELNTELWKLGILAKTQHNEVAPAQHELAPIFTTTNVAGDQNQLTMELMKKIAARHGLACLLHEKPFEGVNGSGKHNNFSISTVEGKNLLSPGDSPADNAQFLIFLSAVVKAVDEYADLLRISVASAGNDHRLGANEAPPAIVSVFLGSELTEILDCILEDRPYEGKGGQVIRIGASVLPDFPKDNTDRNRTSPFAFTGNKFEFRMVGSSQSLAYSEVVLDTILADSFDAFATRLEDAQDKQEEIRHIIADTMHQHGRVIYNGNNYSEDWVREAQHRGLPVLRTSVEAFHTLTDPKNIELFDRYRVFSPKETAARYEIQLDNYIHVIQIEAATMLEIAKRQIIPSCIQYSGKIAGSLRQMQECGLSAKRLQNHVEMVAESLESIMALTEELERTVNLASSFEDLYARARYMAEDVCGAMDRLRTRCDALETVVDRRDWPMPTYTDLLHRI